MGSDADPLHETTDSETQSDGSLETAFLREVAFSPPIEPPGTLLVRPGDTVGRFRIEQLVGRGGMGVVYAARDLTLGRRVALKLLTGGKTNGDEQAESLLREARATALVSHPNLATLFDIGQANGFFFIAMELVEGRTLRAVLEASRVPLADVVRIANAMALGLAAIHGACLIHRDIKPENVMIANSGATKILDFGLAELGELGDGVGESVATTTGDATALARRWVGTPSYMSPEQVRGACADARSDVFSLGIVLYEMLTGERPFRGATTGDVLAAIVHDAPASMPAPSDATRARLFFITLRCLQKDPRDRYAHAGEVASALNETRAPAVQRPRRWLAITPVGAALLVLGVLAWQRRIPSQGPALDVASPNTKASPTVPASPTRAGSMVDLPLPASSSAGALTAYKSAIQSFHDSNWGQAELSLREALMLDPTLGVAYLRLALIVSYLDYTAAEAKAIYREAMRLRNTLSPRDRGLLEALEPLLNADRVDLGETERRITELTERYPRDAELFNLLSIYRRWEGPSGQLEAAERALSIDPDYPDAWAGVAEALADRDPAASIAASDRCISIAPTASDCRKVRATLESGLGRCEQAEQHIRRATDDPRASESMFLLRAMFLYALGEPREAVADAFRQRWARLPSSAAQEDTLYDSAVVSVAYGDFETAKSKAEEGLRLIDTQATLRSHARFLQLLAEIEIETGHTKAAAAIASSFLTRKSAWQRGLPTEDPTIFLTRVVARAGGLSAREVRARRDSWYQSAMESVAQKRTPQRSLWRLAYVQGIERRDEGLEALAARSAGDEGTILDDALDASLGRVLFLAGQSEEALPYLARAHHRCDRLASIMSAMRSDLLYGYALEKHGDRARACGAYRAVLGHWGNAKPRSMTADHARGRSASLGCTGK